MNNSIYFKKVVQLISDVLGLEISSIGEKTILTSIENHFHNSNFNDTQQYFDCLSNNPEFLQSLIEQIVVPETWFFRDLHPFLFLKKHIIENKDNLLKNNNIKVLSVPCSTGEEPYSVAITFYELGLTNHQFQIDAIDISQNAINFAKKGIYNKSSFRENINLNNKYFKIEDNLYYLNDLIINSVNFYICNILSHSNINDNEKYNIILCRNLLIYLNDISRANLINYLKQHLDNEGILIVGHSETHLIQSFGFKSVNVPKSFAFIKYDKKQQIIIKDKETNKSSKKSNQFNYLEQNHINTIKYNSLVDNYKTIEPSEKVAKKPQAIKEKNINIEKIKDIADSGNLLEAKELCQEYLIDNPTESDAYYIFGLINQAMDNINIAIENYEKALYLNPNHYEALIILSILLENKGDKAKANLLRARANKLNKGA